MEKPSNMNIRPLTEYFYQVDPPTPEVRFGGGSLDEAGDVVFDLEHLQGQPDENEIEALAAQTPDACVQFDNVVVGHVLPEPDAAVMGLEIDNTMPSGHSGGVLDATSTAFECPDDTELSNTPM